MIKFVSNIYNSNTIIMSLSHHLPKFIKKNYSIIFITLLSFLFTSCMMIFTPRKQKVLLKTSNENSEVYVDGELVGKGKSFKTKLNKHYDEKLQVVIREKNKKDVYDVILKTHKPKLYYVFGIVDGFFALGDSPGNRVCDKCLSFDKELEFNNEGADLVYKTDDKKFLEISNMRINILNKVKDIRFLSVKYNKEDLFTNINEVEEEYQKDQKRLEEKAKKKLEKQKRKGKKEVKTLDGKDDNKIEYYNSSFSEDIYKVLKETNFMDTTNSIFHNDNNTLTLEGSIKKVTTYNISNRWTFFYKTKVDLTWYIKNTYGETLDSISFSEYSGNFTTLHGLKDYHMWNKSIGDAIVISYLKLHKDKNFIENLKVNTNYAINDPVLNIKAPVLNENISNKIDAFKATVIVKSKENNIETGHGSGFSISNDGYILTNYHVISGFSNNKQKEITVITSDGKELPATIIRYNKFKDVALLKIDKVFEKVFYLSGENKADVMMDIYTIGAPKSIDLGQSVSLGIISGFRDLNENKFIQLGMAINAGNSGGPIFDIQGNLHGVVVSKLVGISTEGVGFAIPSYLVPSYLNLNVK